MKHLYCYCSESLNPWKNLALEEYLLDHVPADTLILYLWQNQNTVVIGRNQNVWSECDVNWLRAEGGFIARRLSGGGAVYHDVQNLNFSFVADQDTYDLSRQMNIILQTVSSFGLPAQCSGRNDMVIEGRKFSGNAFFQRNNKHLHHGTLLINTDTEAMNRYLRVSEEKLKSKGVSSVKSRIVNLQELNPEITVDTAKARILDITAQICCMEPEEWTLSDSDQSDINALERKFSSWEWIFGRRIPFTWSKEGYFSWGGADIRLSVNRGIVEQAVIYSDAMDAKFIEFLQSRITGNRFGDIQTADVIDLSDIQIDH